MAYRMEERDIIIDGWEKGVSQNPFSGIADMRCVDASTVEGEASIAMSTRVVNTQATITDVTFTVDAGTDVITYDGVVPLEVNTPITVANSGGGLPAGMTANTTYYVLAIPSPTTFTVSATVGGAVLNITSAGTGTQSFSTIQMGTPQFYTSTTLLQFYVVYFMLDSNGRCWVDDSVLYGGTNKWIYMNNLASEGTTKGGNGLMAWKNWVFVFDAEALNIIPLHSNLVSTMAFLTTNASWTRTWKNSTDILYIGNAGVSHQAIIDVEDVMYFCNGYNVGSIQEVDGKVFAPNTGRAVSDGVTTINTPNISSATLAFTLKDIGSEITGTGIPAGTYIKSVTSATAVVLTQNATANGTGITFTIPTSYTFSNSALVLPSTDEATCLAELGGNLLVGGINNSVYPWDKISTGYNFPIFLAENYVTRMVTINTTTYIFAGRRGRIFMTNGTNANMFYKLPDYLSNTVNPTFVWKDAVFSRSQLYFGFSVKQNNGTDVSEYGGLWTVDTNTGAGWLVNKLSYNTYAGFVSALLSFRGVSKSTTSTTGIFGSDDGYGLFIGWNDGSVGGCDITESAPYVNGEAYVVSDMIPVGLYLTKRTFENLEYKLTAPLVAGESVALSYRSSFVGSFTDVPITQGGETGEISGTGNVNFENIQWIQIKATFTGVASNGSYVRLRELRIR